MDGCGVIGRLEIVETLPNLTPWNPGLGLVFAFMLLRGARYAAVLFAGAVIAEIAVLRSNLAWSVIISIAAIIAAGYGLVARVARDKLRLDAGLNRLRDVVLLLVSGVAGAVLVAVFICLLLLADEDLDLEDVLVAAGPLLTGDITGIAGLTPLALRLASHPRWLLDRLSLRVLLELLLFVAVVAAALWVIIGAAGPDGFKRFYLVFLPVVVAATRYGLDGACIGLAVTQLGLVGLLHGYGYDANAFTELQPLMPLLGRPLDGRSEADRAPACVRCEIETRLKAKEAGGQAALQSGERARGCAHGINHDMSPPARLATPPAQLRYDLARANTNLSNLIKQIDHAGGVVSRMREFLRRGRPHSSTIVAGELLSGALALAGADVTAKGIAMALDAPDDLPAFHGDAIQLQEVVLNLVRNAAEAIAGARMRDGCICIVARRLGETNGSIAVADNGPGIAAEVADRLFHPLATSKTDGLGLGLSISASIVEAHGGRIWLQAGESGATEFRFSLPLMTDEARLVRPTVS
jgi:signal transduction histidine kinase